MLNRIFTSHAGAAGLLLGLSLGAGAPVRALPVPSVAVSYADLDLANAADVRRLFQRLQHAAEVVCPEQPAITDLSRRGAWQRCYRDALHRAVLQVKDCELLWAIERDDERRKGGTG
jgi:UrcA family protein